MTPRQLDAATGCGMHIANEFAHAFTTSVERWGTVKVPEFLAQCAHESMKFTHLEESFHYRSAERIQLVFNRTRFPTLASAEAYVGDPQGLANYVYANRNGNGDVDSGDGWRYRGRGVLQLTGRVNYKSYEFASGAAVTTAPWLLLQTDYACDSAAWFWHDRGIDHATGVEAITRLVNGGKHGLAERIMLTHRAIGVLS